MKIFIKNIKSLFCTYEKEKTVVKGEEMSRLPQLNNAWIAIENGLIADYGSMDSFNGIEDWRDLTILDAEGRFVFPTWCDSHTHAVFASSRSGEFIDRLNGMSYEEIAQKGGGILNSAIKLQEMNEDTLFVEAMKRLDEMLQNGTGAVEIKSGYGLTPEAELKMLRVIKRLKDNHALTIKATFLALHAIPQKFKNNSQEYVNLMVNEVLPVVAKEGLADFVDAFCELKYFSVDQMCQLLKAANKLGLKGKVHVNQFTNLGGVAQAVELNALSVDHLEILNNDDIQSLIGKATIPVALPGCSFFLGIPYTPVRSLINAELPVALASDFNPGSSPNSNMNTVNTLACIQMKMKPAEVLNASTLNGAYAMNLSHELGSIAIGKKANLIVTEKYESLDEIFYYFGRNPIASVIINGEIKKNLM
jgi:imidazolonepropionase